MRQYVAELVYQHRATLGEGAIWDDIEDVLWWVDIVEGKVHRFDPVTKEDTTIALETPVGTVVPGLNNILYVAVKDGFAQYDRTSGVLTMLATVEHEHPSIRFNDGKCDPFGRFWAGTLAEDNLPGLGKLYVFERDKKIRVALEGVGVSNGIAWSADGALMYYIDSMTQEARAFDFDVTQGTISPCRTIRTFSETEGTPDGMTIDSAGNLWIALWDGGKVVQIDPMNGKTVTEVVVPGVSRVTSCAFGGGDLRTLFITTASVGVSINEANAGSLFAVHTDSIGVPMQRPQFT